MGVEIQSAGVEAAANAEVQGRQGVSGGVGAGRAEAADKEGDGVILRGNGVASVVRKEKTRPWPLPGKEAVLVGFIQRECEATKAIIDNLKPSDREIENRERRIKELKKLESRIRERKIEYEEARKTFINMLPPDDVAAFRKLSDRAAGIIVG